VEKAFWSRSPLMGRRAPEFALVDDAGSRVSLGSVSGQWVVLHFYPTEDTPDCVCSTHDYTRDLAALDQLDAAVIKVSSATQEQQRVIRGKYGLQRPLFSDVEGKAARLYGAWTEARVEDQVFPRVVRTTLLIDPKGTIRRHWPQVLPGHAARVAETLKSERALDQAMSAQANSAPAGQ
jgi:peroxiredoxin Q/BCP